MKRFNINKFYSLNCLLWLSIIGNILAVLFYFLLFNFIKPVQRDLDFFSNLIWLEYYYIIFIFVLLFAIISCVIELILRKINKLNTFNKIFMPKLYRNIISFIGFMLIPVSFCIFYLLFSLCQYLWNNYFGF